MAGEKVIQAPVIDSHQHFWDPATALYEWMPDAGDPLHRRFGPEDLEPLLQHARVDQTIVVQARSSLDETRSLLETADLTPWIAGVVGWVDFTEPHLSETIGELRAGSGALIGVRHQVEGEPDPDWLARPDVRRGIAVAGAAGLSVDLLVRPRNMPSAVALVRELPHVRFILDHIGKPRTDSDSDSEWRAGLADLAASPNVWCKLSGLQSHFGPLWNSAMLAPWAWRAFNAFGPKRVLFGSDWPVSSPSASYLDVVEWAKAFVHSIGLGSSEQAAVFGTNAVGAYGLEVRRGRAHRNESR